ncbi:MAG: hypothetical protein KDK39_05115 [Leptospiraceae bacterium]|nr:hypothetical protein [Leptospiraceae bacterium]
MVCDEHSIDLLVKSSPGQMDRRAIRWSKVPFRGRALLLWMMLATSLLGNSCDAARGDCLAQDPVCNPLLAVLAWQPFLVGVVGEFGTASCAVDHSQRIGSWRKTGTIGESCAWLRRIEHFQSQWVAVGANSSGGCHAVYSADSVHWTTSDCITGANTQLNALTFGANLYVAGGGNAGGVLRTSSDGITWSAPGTAPANDISDLLYLNGAFYASTNAGVYSSISPLTTAFAIEGAAAAKYNGLGSGPDGRLLAVGTDTGGLGNAMVSVKISGTWSSGSNLFANRDDTSIPAIVTYDANSGYYIALSGITSGGFTGQDCLLDYSTDGLQWNGGYLLHPDCKTTGTDSTQLLTFYFDGLQYRITGMNLSSSQIGFELRSSSIFGPWQIVPTGSQVITEMSLVQ